MTYELSDNIQRGIVFLSKSDKNFLVQAMPMVKPEYFEYPALQRFYFITVEYYKKYKKVPTDDILLEEVKTTKSSNELFSDYKDELQRVNELDRESIENDEYLLDLVETFAKEQAIKDAIISSLSFLKKKQFGNIETAIRDALTVSRDVDLGVDYFNTIGDRWKRLSNTKATKKYQTVFEAMNASLEGGMASKELAMVVAPPGVGKSLYLANQAVRSSVDGLNVLYISLEMSEDRVAQRLDSIFTRIKQDELKHRTTDLEEKFDKILGGHKLGTIKIKEFPTKRATVNSIRSFLVQLRNYENFTPDVIIIDYLELLATDAALAEYQAQERLAQELRGLAIEHDAILWTATQTNREGKKVRLITDTELADSYGKTRVCDLVFSINQDEMEFDKGEARAYIIKSRNGRARYVIPITIDYSTLVVKQKTA